MRLQLGRQLQRPAAGLEPRQRRLGVAVELRGVERGLDELELDVAGWPSEPVRRLGTEVQVLGQEAKNGQLGVALSGAFQIDPSNRSGGRASTAPARAAPSTSRTTPSRPRQRTTPNRTMQDGHPEPARLGRLRLWRWPRRSRLSASRPGTCRPHSRFRRCSSGRRRTRTAARQSRALKNGVKKQPGAIDHAGQHGELGGVRGRTTTSPHSREADAVGTEGDRRPARGRPAAHSNEGKRLTSTSWRLRSQRKPSIRG